MAFQDELLITGARQNNLKNVSLRIPHDEVTVITGVSGSGKSSLAFDTVFAEGQWRYIESLETKARIIQECRREAAAAEARRGFSQVRATQAYPCGTLRRTSEKRPAGREHRPTQ